MMPHNFTQFFYIVTIEYKFHPVITLLESEHAIFFNNTAVSDKCIMKCRKAMDTTKNKAAGQSSKAASDCITDLSLD
jgi:hypothetical protein